MTLDKKQKVKEPKQMLFLGIGGISCVLYGIICVLSGADLLGMAKFFFSVPFYLILPGVALQKLLHIKDTGLRPVLWILYGTGFFVFLVCISVHFQSIWLLQLSPLALSAFCLWQIAKKGTDIYYLYQKHTSQIARGFAIWGVLCLLFALFHAAQNPHPQVAGSVALSRDLLWNIGNGRALSQAFPAEDIRFVGVRFSYHYLTELIVAGLSLVSGASVYDIFVFFSGPVFLLGELIAIYCLGRSFYYNNRKKAIALIVLIFGFQCASMWGIFIQQESIFANTLLKHLLTNINAQATALIFICIFMVLFATISRQKFYADWRILLSCILSFLMLTLAKGPQAGIILCSLIITMGFVFVFQKPHYGKAILFLVALAGGFWVLYQFLFSSGANSSMKFSIFSMEQSLPYQVLSPFTDLLRQKLPFISGYVWLVLIGVANAFCMLPFQFVLWLRGLPQTIRHLFGLDASHILANGVVAGGFLAYHLFLHPNSSQAYFALIAMLFLSLLAVEQLPRLRNKKRIFAYIAGLCGTIAAITTACMLIAYAGKGMQQLAYTTGMVEKEPQLGDVLPQDEQAMNWLVQNTEKDFVFATNRTSSHSKKDDGISNVYSALSGRQAYMEGWTYAVSNMGVAQDVVLHRISVNEQLFSGQLSSAEIMALCKTEGIDGLIYSKDYPGKPPIVLVPSFENDHVIVYLLEKQSQLTKK